MNKEEWLKQRRLALGATDIAAILGLSPYKTAFEVYCDKKDMLEPWEGNAATDLGNMLEPTILDEAEKDLGKLERQKVCKHDAAPIAATLDGLQPEKQIVVEAKTSILGYDKTAWTEETVPEPYWIQVQTQMACAKTDNAHLYAIVAQIGLKKYQIEPHAEFQSYIAEFAKQWWQTHIVENVMPDISKVKSNVLKRIKRIEHKKVDLKNKADDLLEELKILKQSRSRTQSRIDTIQAEILHLMVDAEVGVAADGTRITYTKQTRKGFTVKPSVSRVFRVKENKA